MATFSPLVFRVGGRSAQGVVHADHAAAPVHLPLRPYGAHPRRDRSAHRARGAAAVWQPAHRQRALLDQPADQSEAAESRRVHWRQQLHLGAVAAVSIHAAQSGGTLHGQLQHQGTPARLARQPDW